MPRADLLPAHSLSGSGPRTIDVNAQSVVGADTWCDASIVTCVP